MKKKWSGERLETHIYNRDTIEHLHRYAIASMFVKNKTVLDIACGDGYGTNLLCKDAQFVYGFDIDQETVIQAKNKYSNKNLEYRVGDAAKINLEDNQVDLVVSFETIEHHDKHHEMMKEIRRVLKPDGVLIISTPDKLFYTDKRNYINKFHVKELYKDEFRELIGCYFECNQMLFQKYFEGLSIIEESSDCTLISGNYSHSKIENIDPFYMISIASNSNVKLTSKSVFNGNPLLMSYYEQQFKNSFTYKLGYFLLKPIRFIFKFFK